MAKGKTNLTVEELVARLRERIVYVEAKEKRTLEDMRVLRENYNVLKSLHNSLIKKYQKVVEENEALKEGANKS